MACRPAMISSRSQVGTSHGGGDITRDGCNRGPQAVSPSQTAGHVARNVAAGAPAAVRARAVFHADEPRDRACLLRIPSHESAKWQHLSCGDPWASVGRQLLQLPRLRDQFARYVQAYRVRSAEARGAHTNACDAGARFQPTYSEIVLQYGAKREVRFRPGTSCPRTLTALAMKYFDSQHVLRAGAYGKFESLLSQAAKFNHDLRC